MNKSKKNIFPSFTDFASLAREKTQFCHNRSKQGSLKILTKDISVDPLVLKLFV